MIATPFLGVLLYVIGGLTGASFYLPFKGVKKWAWESYWLVYAVAGLVIVPWALALTMSPNVLSVLRATPWETLGLCFLFGAMWGAGGLTWGLMIRYLGVGLGVAIGCGLCAAVGTLVPPLVLGLADRPELHNESFAAMIQMPGGSLALAVLLTGVVVSLAGIVITGAAGMSKEREMPEEQKKAAVAEFDFKKGILVAIFSGVMSAGMNFGVYASKLGIVPRTHTIKPLTDKIWEGLPGLVVILLGGFTVNVVWVLFLNFKNRSTSDYAKAEAPLARNYLLSALAGAVWYSQMVFYTMGNSQIGAYEFSGWSVFMSAQIIFSTLWGIALLEWTGVSPRTRKLLAAGLAVLVLSLVIIAYGNYLKLPS
jgi:L-rhamnose-H+ transport protein